MTTTLGTESRVVWPDSVGPTWSGCPRALLTDVVEAGVKQFPHNTPLIFDDGFSVSSRELWDEAQRFAHYLRGSIAPGDRIALAIGNRSEFVIAYLAIVASRAVVVMLSPEIGSHEAEYVVRDSDIKLAIVDDDAAPTFKALRPGAGMSLNVIRVRGEEPRGFHHLYAGDAEALAHPDAMVTDLIDIGYTSGTTGLPKALAGNHLEVLRYVDVHLRFHLGKDGSPQRLLMPLQLHYGDPLVAVFAAMYAGTAVILMRKFSATRFWDVARELKATDILTIGSIPDMLLSRPASPADQDHSIQRAIALAIPKDRHVELERRFGFPWREAYGSSESGPAIAMPAEFGPEFVGTGALGIPYPDIDARLVTDAGEVISEAGVGELELNGMVVFDGYLNNDEATAEVLHDGWLRTGDLMRRDERGVYYFEGRRKELIRRSGVNVAPAEVEAVLRLHPDVADAAVVPVADEVMGEEIKAYVELAPGAEFDPGGLADFCAARLERTKVPRYLEQRTDPFPRTETQRIRKNELRVDGAHQTTTAWDRAGVGAKGVSK